MDSRIQGVLLLTSVMLAAIVGPSLQGRLVDGTAAIGTIPLPPHVGQCLLQSPPDLSVLSNPGQSYRLGPCCGLGPHVLPWA